MDCHEGKEAIGAGSQREWTAEILASKDSGQQRDQTARELDSTGAGWRGWRRPRTAAPPHGALV